MKIKEIAFVGYPSTDIARSRKFYEEVLGLKLTMETPCGSWFEYDIGAGTLAIGKYEQWTPSPNGPSAALEVEDFADAVAHLRANAVPFVMEPMESPVCHMAIVSDPDGNSLVIHQRKV